MQGVTGSSPVVSTKKSSFVRMRIFYLFTFRSSLFTTCRYLTIFAGKKAPPVGAQGARRGRLLTSVRWAAHVGLTFDFLLCLGKSYRCITVKMSTDLYRSIFECVVLRYEGRSMIYQTVPDITTVAVPGTTVQAPVVVSCVNAAAGTVILPASEANSPVAVL